MGDVDELFKTRQLQATKEIGGRLVLATFQVQGKDQTGRTKRPVRPKPCASVSKGKLAKSNDEQVNAGDQSEKGSIFSSKLGKLFSTRTIKQQSKEVIVASLRVYFHGFSSFDFRDLIHKKENDLELCYSRKL